MKANLLTLVLILAISISGKAQSVQKTDAGIKTIINSVEVEIQFYDKSTVRVLKHPVGKDFTKESLSVIKAPQKTAFKVSQQGDNLSLKSESLRIDLNLKLRSISEPLKVILSISIVKDIPCTSLVCPLYL